MLTILNYVCAYKVADMENDRKRLFEDTCWVYVRRNEEGIYLIGVTYDGDFRQNKTFAGNPILLWRKFDDTLSAAGYRMVLKGLTVAALEKEMKKYPVADDGRI